jgi:MFS family permease
MERTDEAHPLDRFFVRNVTGISLVELLWGLGMPVVFESTFLPLFMRHLGASSFLVGLVPMLSSAGVAVSSLLAYSLTAHRQRKKTAVVVVHVVTSLPLLFFGLLLLFTGFSPSTLALFLCAYAAFSLAVGLILPVWQNYIVKIFSDKRTGPAMGTMMIAQSAARLAGSLFLARVVEVYSFSARGAGMVFTLMGTLFLLGSFPFILTVEEAGRHSPGRSALPRHLSSIRRLFANRAYLAFLATELEYFALAGVIAFYANYATELCGVSPAVASGLFAALGCSGGVLVNGILGWGNLLSLRGKYVLTKSLAVSGVLLMAFHSALWVFLLTSFLMGVSRGTRSMVFAPAVKRLSGQADATLYFSFAPILLLPLSTGLPLANGAFLDAASGLGAWSYRIVFLAMAALCGVGLFFSVRMGRGGDVHHDTEKISGGAAGSAATSSRSI